MTAPVTPTQETRFIDACLANPVNAAILARMPSLPLPQGMLVSGCLYQSVWNALCDHPPGHGIRDYDLAYFDDSDLSYEAEDRVIKTCAAAFADLGVEVEVRNQARVHLWFAQKFGAPYPPLSAPQEALERYAALCHAVALAPKASGGVMLYAPFGLDDIFAMIMRPNPDAPAKDGQSYGAKAARAKSVWPRLTIMPWQGKTSGALHATR